MAKKLFVLLTAIALCVPIFADILGDGLISEGEYAPGITEWTISDPPLIVEGGGAVEIEMRNYSSLEVRYTSIPDQNWRNGGIRDIDLKDDSSLLYLGGYTHAIVTREDAVAALKGGYISYLQSYFDFMSTGHVDIYCQPGWSWLVDGDLHKVGITGLWEDGTTFDIGFIDKEDHDAVWMGINVIEVPEPVSFLLISLGGILLRRRK